MASIIRNTRPSKIPCFEWARGIAAAMVVLLHVTQGIMTNYPIERVGFVRAVSWTVSQFVLTRWEVPVFLMISGALLLNPAKGIGWADVWRYERRMLRVLLPFGLLFCLMEQYAESRRVDLALLGNSVLNLLSGRSWSHLWYIYAMVGIYILLPMFKAFIDNADRHSLETFLTLFFALTVAVPSVNDALGTDLVTLVWLPSYVFYFLLGYYLWVYGSSSRRVSACLALVVMVGCLAQAAYVLSGDYGDWLRSADSVFVTALSVLVFLAMRRLFDRPYKSGGVVERLSSYSFGIYVVHPLFLNVAYKVVGIGPWSMPPGVFETTMWSWAFFGSIVLVWAMRRIPGLRKIV